MASQRIRCAALVGANPAKFARPRCVAHETGDVMADLIPPPGLEQTLPTDISPDQRIAVWIDLMETADELLLAGLRREVGPDGDLREAYRRWFAGYRAEHDKANKQMMEKLRTLGT